MGRKTNFIIYVICLTTFVGTPGWKKTYGQESRLVRAFIKFLEEGRVNEVPKFEPRPFPTHDNFKFPKTDPDYPHKWGDIKPGNFRDIPLFLDRTQLTSEESKAVADIMALCPFLEDKRGFVTFMVRKRQSSMKQDQLKSDFNKFKSDRTEFLASHKTTSKETLFEADDISMNQIDIGVYGKITGNDFSANYSAIKKRKELFRKLNGSFKKYEDDQREALSSLLINLDYPNNKSNIITRSLNDLNSYIFIKMNNNGSYQVNTSTSNFTCKDYKQTLESFSDFKKKKIYIDGKVDEDFAGYLRSKRITSYCNLDYLVANTEEIPREMQLILIASDDANELKSLYEVRDESSFQQLTNLILKAKIIPGVKVVGSESALNKVVAVAKQNKKTPVVIFNNKNGKLFDKEISTFGISDVLTCNSYSLNDETLYYNTTTYLYLKDVINTLESSKGFTGKKFKRDDFYNQFFARYNEVQSRRVTNKIIYTTVAIALPVAGGVTGITCFTTAKPTSDTIKPNNDTIKTK